MIICRDVKKQCHCKDYETKKYDSVLTNLIERQKFPFILFK